MATDRSSAPSWTFGYAVFWGAFTVVVALAAPEGYPSAAISIATAILGLVTVGLGVGVYRRRLLAAWALVGLALLDIAVSIRSHRSGYLMPGILLALAMASVSAIRKERQAPAIQN